MNELVHLAAAANTMAPALAVLCRKGYVVTRQGYTYRADSGARSLLADDPLQLLGLAALLDERGESWQSTDEEIDALIALDAE
jgi:hypothetical protein